MSQTPDPTSPPLRLSSPLRPSSPAPPPAGELLDPQTAFAELSKLVGGATPLSQVLDRLAQLTQGCLPGAQEVSLTLVEGEQARSAAFTGKLAASLDEGQYESGLGPCIDAAQSGQVVRVDDTAAEELYPDFAAIAADQGVRSTLSVGIPKPQRIVGGINVYRFDVGVLDEEAVATLQTFAAYAAVALANHSLFAAWMALSANLQVAMHSRAVIEQAKGVLVESLHCTPQEAFTHLDEWSQHTHRKLREVAVEIVEGAGRG